MAQSELTRKPVARPAVSNQCEAVSAMQSDAPPALDLTPANPHCIPEVISDTFQEFPVEVSWGAGNIAVHWALDRISSNADEGRRATEERRKATPHSNEPKSDNLRQLNGEGRIGLACGEAGKKGCRREPF
jgi:hypothetical protein